MDCKIWKETVVSWVNSLDVFENDAKELTPKTVEEILKVVLAEPDGNIFNFIHTNFPNYEINYVSLETATDRDILCTCTLLLMYVCFSTKCEMEALRQKMCVKLDSTDQENVTEFLMNINEQGDAFSCSQKLIIEEILKFSQRHSLGHSAYGDGCGTPVKSFGSPSSCKSPLLEFLQTPKRKMESKYRLAFNSYSNNEQLKKIKNLTDQLVEEELEKASLQERLKQTEITCNEHEMRLNMKIKELEQIKADWQQDIFNNEEEIKQFQNIIKNDAEEREKLSKELNYLEKYVITLENDLSNATSEKKTLEERLKCALNKVNEQESSIIQLTGVVTELKDVIKAQEEDLQSLKENGVNTFENTFMDQYVDETLDTSATVPENMEVVIEMLLKEKTEENETLKEAIEVIKCDKEYLAKEVKILKSQLSAMELEKGQLQELNRILVGKIDCFVKTCKDLQNMQSRLLSITKVVSDNTGDNVSTIEKTEAAAGDDGNNENNIKNSDDALLTALNAIDSKELHVIYDSSKELTDSISQLSFDDNDATHLATIMESLNESEDISSLSDSVVTNNDNKTGLEHFQMEQLSQEILTAKKSLVSFLKASMKNFEVLKIKESLLNAMSKEHEQLENRVMSLTELNARLTKEILKSSNISHIDSKFREQELENLRLEVESLKKASEILREKLTDLEKTNESLMNKKKEYLAELTIMREKNKSLNNELQNKVMSQLKQQNACLGFIRNKQETDLELEKSLRLKEEIDKRFLELRKTISRDTNSALEIMSNVAEQKFYVTSQNLLHTTYSILKWCAKIMQHQCFFIEQDENYSEDKLSENMLKKEQEEHREKLKQILSNFNDLSDELNTIEMKYNETNNLSDSLKIIPPVNKTFEIINVDDENINEKTFSIKREMSEIKLAKSCNTTWVISPPTKQIRKVESQLVSQPKKNLTHATSWVITMSPPEKPNQTSEKSEAVRKKSLYYSAVSDIEYSPTSKPEVTKSSSSSSFVSASGTVDFSESQAVENVIGVVADKKSVQVKEEKGIISCCEKIDCSELREHLEKQIRDLQKELVAAVKENELVRAQLTEQEEQRKREKDNFEKRQETTRQSITAKYENQLEHLKSEMKLLYNRELAKYKAEQSKKNYELLEQNKVYKDHVDELRNQLWDLGEKLLHEQKLKRDLEQTVEQIKKKLTSMSYNEFESRNSQDSDFPRKKERPLEENFPPTYKQFGSSSLVTMPTEDEDEVFDNRCLEDMKAGVCKVEGPEGRLTELQYRNSLCLPHLKSSYPAETQFHNPDLYKENDLKYGGLNFGQESQSLTDSDHSMTRSLLPGEKGKKKEQPSYKKPGPPTPSKNGGRLSIQSGDFHITPRRPLRDANDFSDRKSTPARIKALFTTKSGKQDVSKKDENTAPTACRGKKLKIFPSVKPFGGRDY